MSWLVPKYTLKKGWGHTVRLVDPYADSNEFGTVVDYEAVDSILEWATANSCGNRIGYDMWKFGTKQEAEEFILMFTLQYGK